MQMVNYTDQATGRGQVGEDGYYKPGYQDLLDATAFAGDYRSDMACAPRLHREVRTYVDPVSKSKWRLASTHIKQLGFSMDDYQFPARSRAWWLLGTLEVAASRSGDPIDLAHGLREQEPWLKERAAIAKLHLDGIENADIYRDNICYQGWGKRQSYEVNGRRAIRAFTKAYRMAKGLGDDDLAWTIQSDADVMLSTRGLATPRWEGFDRSDTIISTEPERHDPPRTEREPMTTHYLAEKTTKPDDPLWEWFIGKDDDFIDVKYTQPSRYDWDCEPDTPLSTTLVQAVKYHSGTRVLATDGTATSGGHAHRVTPHGDVNLREYTSEVVYPHSASVRKEERWSRLDLECMLEALGTRLAEKTEVDFVKDLAEVNVVDIRLDDTNIEMCLSDSLDALPGSISQPSFLMHPWTWFKIRHQLISRGDPIVDANARDIDRQLAGCDVLLSDGFTPPSGSRLASQLAFEPDSITWAVGDFRPFVVYDEGRIRLHKFAKEDRNSVQATMRAGARLSHLLHASKSDKPIVALRSPMA